MRVDWKILDRETWDAVKCTTNVKTSVSRLRPLSDPKWARRIPMGPAASRDIGLSNSQGRGLLSLHHQRTNGSWQVENMWWLFVGGGE
jgi:hypothetical protein